MIVKIVVMPTSPTPFRRRLPRPGKEKKHPAQQENRTRTAVVEQGMDGLPK